MNIILFLHSALYGTPTTFFIFSFFLYVNFKTRFVGIRKIKSAGKAVFAPADKNNGISPLKSACVSLCATVGTGNIVGVAGAVTLGGPGAVFWMWISALLALSVKFSEIYLSSLYKHKGGAFSYIFSAFNSRFLKNTFLVFGIIAAIGIGNLTQTNAAAGAGAFLFTGMGVSPRAVRSFLGFLFLVLCLVFLKREAGAVKFCEICLPFMAFGYISLCGFSLFLMRNVLPDVFLSIIKGAFSPRAVTGGAVGSALFAVRTGISRGIFSNEAGLSTSAIAYEKSKNSAVILSLFGIFEVAVDTLILCTMTALVIISSGTAVYGQDLGAYTTLSAFIGILGKSQAFIFCITVCFFAFSSVIGWGIYARRFAGMLNIPENIVVVFYSSCCMFGAIFKADIIWKIAEIGVILMMCLNGAAIIIHRDKLSYKKIEREFKKNTFIF